MKKHWILTLAAASAVSTLSLAQATGGASGTNAGTNADTATNADTGTNVGTGAPLPGLSTGVSTGQQQGGATATGATAGGTAPGGAAAGGPTSTAGQLQVEAARLRAGVTAGSTATGGTVGGTGTSMTGTNTGRDMIGTGVPRTDAPGGVNLNRDAQPSVIRSDTSIGTSARNAQPGATGLRVGSDMVGTSHAGVAVPADTTTVGVADSDNDQRLNEPTGLISAPSAGVSAAPGGAFQGNDPTSGQQATSGNFGNQPGVTLSAPGATTQPAQPAGARLGDDLTLTPGATAAGSGTLDIGGQGTPAGARIDVNRAASELGRTPPLVTTPSVTIPPVTTTPPATTTPPVASPPIAVQRSQGGLSDQPPLSRQPTAQPAAANLQPMQDPPSGSNQSDVAR